MKWLENRMRIVRKAGLILFDAISVIISMLFSAAVRLGDEVGTDGVWQLTMERMPTMVILFLVACMLFDVYRILWQYAGGGDYIRLGLAAGTSTMVMLGIEMLSDPHVSRIILVMTGLCAFILSSSGRYTWRIICSRMAQKNRDIDDGEDITEHCRQRRILIVGAGGGGSWGITECRRDRYGEPVAVVDDAFIKKGLTIQGVPIEGCINDIPAIVREKEISDILIAMPSVQGKRMQEIVEICISTRCRVTTMTRPHEVNGHSQMPTMRRLNTADFLARDEVKLDTKSISGYLSGSVVLVTGGGGSIGSEICRQVMRFSPARLIIFDIYENSAYELLYELRRRYGEDTPVTVLIGSVRDKLRLDQVMDAYHPDVVFHAAAHKHVPLMEDSPAEAVKNNIFGTRNLLYSAAEHGVKRFVILSTDKAVNPTSVMGATKRVTEMIIQTLGKKTGMKCMAVRFGNVLGSHGSVIPLFEEQIRVGGPVTVTHPEMTRYFMTIPEAAQLVLQAGGMAINGAIFVLDMGKPVKIVELARKLILVYGLEPDVDIQIKYTGLRPGEKLYEELLMDAEEGSMTKTGHDLIFVAPPIPMNEELFCRQLNQIQALCEENSDRVVDKLAEIVPTFRHMTPEKDG